MPAPLLRDVASPSEAGPRDAGPCARRSHPWGSTWAQRTQRIIVLGGLLLSLALGLAGCSAVRLGYEQGPAIATWWLDRRIDFNDEQKAMVRASLDRWFAWHRRTQLPVYAEALARAATESSGPLTAARLCAVADELRGWLPPAVDQILPAVATLAATLSPAQVERLAERLSRDTEERLQKAAKASAAERREAATDRLVDRYSSLYGPLEPGQIALLEASARSELQDVRQQTEMRRAREAAVIEGLRRIAAQRLSGVEALTVVRDAARRVLQPPSPDGGAWVEQVRQHGCQTAARLHATATPEQRKHLMRRLKDWERDARQLSLR